MMTEESANSLAFTPTWVVAIVCFVIVLISLCVERALHRLGKCLKHKQQDTLFQALNKLKEELMLLGFISLLLTVFQDAISRICIPPHLASHMLPCVKKIASHEKFYHGRRLLSSEDASFQHCSSMGKVPLLSLEALHQLHIFIFVLAVVHVVFCVVTMVLGGMKIREWKQWEDSVQRDPRPVKAPTKENAVWRHFEQFHKRAIGYWRKAAVVSWLISFFKQFYGSVTKSDYIALRQGFIMAHCPANTKFDFHEYMMRTLEVDFKKVVGIRWYMWLFVVIFLLLNVGGWHTYFWLAFLPLVLQLLVGAKLEHIIMRLAQDVDQMKIQDQGAVAVLVNPSDHYFWFSRPRFVLDLIHFILFQNAFEIAFFFWILSTYGFKSCIMEKVSYVIPRLIISVMVQVMCSYSTLPLYALVTQMGTRYKKGIFDDFVQSSIDDWIQNSKSRGNTSKREDSVAARTQMNKLDARFSQEMIVIEAESAPLTQLSSVPSTVIQPSP